MKRAKQTTTTTLVLEALIKRDDFMDYAMIMEAIARSYNAVTAALHHLRKRRAVDVVINPDGHSWWYATPENDNRSYHRDEIAIETKPRKPRKYKQPRAKKGEQQ